MREADSLPYNPSVLLRNPPPFTQGRLLSLAITHHRTKMILNISAGASPRPTTWQQSHHCVAFGVGNHFENLHFIAGVAIHIDVVLICAVGALELVGKVFLAF